MRGCKGSSVSVGEEKLSHRIAPVESLMMRLPVSRRETVVPSPELVPLSQVTVPLISVRTKFPVWSSDTLEPWPFTGDLGFADHTAVFSTASVNQIEKVNAFPPASLKPQEKSLFGEVRKACLCSSTDKDEPVLSVDWAKACEHGRMASNGRMVRKKNVPIFLGVERVVWSKVLASTYDCSFPHVPLHTDGQLI